MNKDILVVGSVALDSVETPHGKSKDALGGSAVYFSLAARFFNRVRMVGVVGEDFPAPYRKLLTDRDVDIGGLKVLKGKTFRWSGRFEGDMRDAKTLSTKVNVFEKFKPELSEPHRQSSIAFLGNIDPHLQWDVLSQLQGPRLVACDTHSFWISSKKSALKELLSHVDVFFVNENEAVKLTGQPSLLKAGRTLGSWGPRAVIVKKGEHGATLFFKDRHVTLPAWPVEEVKDPTGAGDTFAGGFLGYLSSQPDWESLVQLKRAMAYGSALASFNVEDFGTRRVAALTVEDIHRRFRQYVDALQIEDAAVPVSA